MKDETNFAPQLRALLTQRAQRTQRGGIILNFECFPAVEDIAHAKAAKDAKGEGDYS
jgi:hypothetical protein